MKTLPLLFLFVSLGSEICFARLGENFAESVARYGVPISPQAETENCRSAKFETNGMGITAHFYQNLCVEIEYVRLRGKLLTEPGEPPVYADPESMTIPEVEALLEQNPSLETWKDPAFGEIIKTMDDERKGCFFNGTNHFSAYWRFSGALTIYSKSYDAYQQEIDKSQQSKDQTTAKKATEGL